MGDTQSSDIRACAQEHGIAVVGEITTNEMGLDFQVAFARAEDGQAWVLRLPRRPASMVRAAYERRVLEFLAPRLPVAVPDWQVVSERLIAYPLLPGQPALTFDATTYAVDWHMAKDSPEYPRQLGRILAALHAIPLEDAQQAHVECLAPGDLRSDLAGKVDRVCRELGIAAGLHARLQAWLDHDTLWPDFTTFTHGDLYAGHVLVDAHARPTAIIDWTEARFSDPAIDFVGHLNIFGADSLSVLLQAYQDAGGRTWPDMAAHIGERVAAALVLYGIYALTTADPKHLADAKAQLNASAA